jgi:hypothetical protein
MDSYPSSGDILKCRGTAGRGKTKGSDLWPATNAHRFTLKNSSKEQMINRAEPKETSNGNPEVDTLPHGLPASRRGPAFDDAPYEGMRCATPLMLF